MVLIWLTILSAEKLNAVIYKMVVEAPLVAKHCLPGQFIIVKKSPAVRGFLSFGLLRPEGARNDVVD